MAATRRGAPDGEQVEKDRCYWDEVMNSNQLRYSERSRECG
jgi:hypothetical protein